MLVRIILGKGKRVVTTDSANYGQLMFALVVVLFLLVVILQAQLIHKGDMCDGPYGFALMEEYRSYRRIGRSRSSFKRYSDWRTHILETIDDLDHGAGTTNLDNYYHYMRRLRREYASAKEFLLGIQIPLVITTGFALATVVQDDPRYPLIIYGFYLLIILSMTALYMVADGKMQFIEDVMEIVEERQKGVTNGASRV